MAISTTTPAIATIARISRSVSIPGALTRPPGPPVGGRAAPPAALMASLSTSPIRPERADATRSHSSHLHSTRSQACSPAVLDDRTVRRRRRRASDQAGARAPVGADLGDPRRGDLDPHGDVAALEQLD